MKKTKITEGQIIGIPTRQKSGRYLPRARHQSADVLSMEKQVLRLGRSAFKEDEGA